MRISFFTASPFKDTKNRFNNVQKQDKCDKQNQKLGNYYTNGYKKGTICTVTKISGNWGLTPSGWISLNYCVKL